MTVNVNMENHLPKQLISANNSPNMIYIEYRGTPSSSRDKKGASFFNDDLTDLTRNDEAKITYFLICDVGVYHTNNI